MIDTPYEPTACRGTNQQQAALQEYVRALLARQQALDLLDTIHLQIGQVWTVMRKLLDGAGAAGRAAQAVRVARAALATQAQKSYHSLERRREECIAALNQAESRANSAFQSVLTTRQTGRVSRSGSNRRLQTRGRFASRTTGRKVKTASVANN